MTKYMPGIDYVGPHKMASVVNVNKIYARNRFCWRNVCQEYVMLNYIKRQVL